MHPANSFQLAIQRNIVTTNIEPALISPVLTVIQGSFSSPPVSTIEVLYRNVKRDPDEFLGNGIHRSEQLIIGQSQRLGGDEISLDIDSRIVPMSNLMRRSILVDVISLRVRATYLGDRSGPLGSELHLRFRL